MSSGRAPCPLEEITYCGFSLEFESTVIDGGKVEGTLLYVYGSVTAVGKEMNGETVNGTWASSGCDSGQG
jgi:hypothetical protein